MKLALLSDIHSNIEALRAVLTSVRQMKIDTLLIAGDFVGYYFDLHSIFDEMADFKIYACKGNHDEQYLNYLKGTYIDKNDRYNYRNITFESNEYCHIEFLEKLNETVFVVIDGSRFLICHGSPWKRDSYIYPDMNLEEVGDYQNLPVDVIIQGHTHYQMVKTLKDKIVINPGSVGQPRSIRDASEPKEKFRAQWAIFDTATKLVTHMTEYYDKKKLTKKCLSISPNNIYILKVLQR